jgi:hypothetical protein
MKFLVLLISILFGFGFIDCSSVQIERQSAIDNGIGSLITYDGRFSIIEPFPGFETIDANKFMIQCKEGLLESQPV